MNRAALALLLPLVALLLLVPSAVPAAAPSQYRPHAGDRFAYAEVALVSDGQGNYSGYTDEGYYNGSIAVTSVAPNATANATYTSAGTYQNSLATHYPWSEHGAFSFSAITYLYVNGTDNQTGYTNPSVWFLMDNALAPGGTFTLLNTPMRVVSESAPFATPTSPTGYAEAIFAEGNGTYQRNDGYGTFTATYNWKAYFDPGTGYALGYVVTETDSDGAGDGFTYTDTVTDTSTSFPVTSVAAPATPPSSPGPSSNTSLVFVAVAVLVILVIVVLVALILRGRSRRTPLARHPTTPITGAMPPYTPPAVRFIPSDQPMVQQVVIRETVKVPCRYCGTLMDSTALNCPKCGAPRT
jgi:hypothetical protein